MSIERTFSIIKPDAVRKGLIGEILGRLEKGGLHPVAMRMIHMSRQQAEGFYSEHKGKPFYEGLIEFMVSGPCIVQVLEGENAIEQYRNIMGATNFKEAKPGTIRADFAESVCSNCVHGSDASETALREISFFFSTIELVRR
jgi:nucleoside-diphosphate kinase